MHAQGGTRKKFEGTRKIKIYYIIFIFKNKLHHNVSTFAVSLSSLKIRLKKI